MNKRTKVSYLAVIVLALTFSFISLAAIAKNDGNAKNNKSDKKSEANKERRVVNFKNFAIPNKNKGETNAQMHREKISEVTKNLEEVASEENSGGNTEVGDQIEQVVDEQEQTQNETTDAIEEIENRNKVKTFLVGTDYKNLGQLRSSLVHNRNEIRKLTETLNQTQTEENKILLEQQLTILMAERERIKTIITNNEESFSLFGWVSRFLNNYEETPVDNQEEENLTNEVEEAINNADNTATTPITTPIESTDSNI